MIDRLVESDRACEALIKSRIVAKYPHHGFIGEETHTGAYDLTSARVTWVVDPIDGTNNFVHSLMHVCVSIGILINGEIAVALIHNPIMLETYHAIKGHGAFLTHHYLITAAVVDENDTFSVTHSSSAAMPIKVSDIQTLNRSAVITELGYDRSAEGIAEQIERLRILTVEKGLQSFRSYGSCALNICYVACGRTEAYYEGKNTQYGPKLWDSVAAQLVLTEAGGVMRDTNGGPFDPTSGRVLAANSTQMAEQIIDTCANAAKNTAQ